MTQFFDAGLRRHGIRTSQAQILLALKAQNRWNMAELSSALGMEHGILLAIAGEIASRPVRACTGSRDRYHAITSRGVARVRGDGYPSNESRELWHRVAGNGLHAKPSLAVLSSYAGRCENAVHQPFGLIGPVITLHLPSAVAVFPGTNSEHPEHF